MIPIKLQEEAEFCLWKREWRGDRPTKIPYDPHTEDKAKSNDPSTFAPYEYTMEKLETLGEYDGIGIRVSKGFAAVDIDHCIEDGAFSDLASEIMDYMNSYTELSPSKSGLRIMFRTDAQYDKNKYYLKNPHNGVELYVTGMTERFVTITGNTVLNAPLRTLSAEELVEFCKRYMNRDKSSTDKLTDDEIISKAKQSDKFADLFAGDMVAYNNDHSSADLALCNILAFWCQKDTAQMDRIFRKSGLYRADKWERDDYRNATLSKACNDTETTYNPQVARQIWDRLDVRTLLTGAYTVDYSGVWEDVMVKKEMVHSCITPTPVVIAFFLENDVHRVELHYLYNGTQRSVVVDREVIANKNKIITLSNFGIAVNSETALPLVKYFAELERLNPVAIPHQRSCSRLGWVNNDFVPYTESIKFDGEQENKALYQSVETSGSYDVWKEHVAELRKNSAIRLMTDASFGSVLIEKLNALPFVFHLWGTTSFGKTVSLMVAMSIWGDPSPGRLVRTMNMTNASMMSTASFLYSLPFAGDELQTIKESGTTYDKLIMQITEGIERGRMLYNKNLPTRSWHNAFIFTGEDPCTSEKSGGGVLNRVIEMPISQKIIQDGNKTVKIVTANHGHAGQKFVEYVSHCTGLQAEYDDIYQELLRTTDSTDKQCSTASLIVLADRLVNRSIFNENDEGVSLISPYLKSLKTVSTGGRAEDYTVGWIAQNMQHFDFTQNTAIYGCKEGKSIFIIKSVLDEMLEKAGFNFDAVKQAWKDSEFLIPTVDGRFSKRKGVGGATPYCVELLLRKETDKDGNEA